MFVFFSFPMMWFQCPKCHVTWRFSICWACEVGEEEEEEEHEQTNNGGEDLDDDTKTTAAAAAAAAATTKKTKKKKKNKKRQDGDEDDDDAVLADAMEKARREKAAVAAAAAATETATIAAAAVAFKPFSALLNTVKVMAEMAETDPAAAESLHRSLSVWRELFEMGKLDPHKKMSAIRLLHNMRTVSKSKASGGGGSAKAAGFFAVTRTLILERNLRAIWIYDHLFVKNITAPLRTLDVDEIGRAMHETFVFPMDQRTFVSMASRLGVEVVMREKCGVCL